jgi:hypothetical protein
MARKWQASVSVGGRHARHTLTHAHARAHTHTHAHVQAREGTLRCEDAIAEEEETRVTARRTQDDVVRGVFAAKAARR